jgi:Gram-negative bacterial TonB protein C-terminal
MRYRRARAHVREVSGGILSSSRRANAAAILLCASLFVPYEACAAQGNSSVAHSQSGVVLTKLVQPIYPQIARTAHITGDVDLTLTFRPNGAIDSIAVASGPPLLIKSAEDSVRQSQFECRGCTEPFTTYRLVYAFEIEGACECEPKEKASANKEPQRVYPQAPDAKNRITVVAHVLCSCDPSSTFVRARSIKCLYLWRCGGIE